MEPGRHHSVRRAPGERVPDATRGQSATPPSYTLGRAGARHLLRHAVDGRFSSAARSGAGVCSPPRVRPTRWSTVDRPGRHSADAADSGAPIRAALFADVPDEGSRSGRAHGDFVAAAPGPGFPSSPPAPTPADSRRCRNTGLRALYAILFSPRSPWHTEHGPRDPAQPSPAARLRLQPATGRWRRLSRRRRRRGCGPKAGGGRVGLRAERRRPIPTVAAVIIHRAVGSQLTCIFVDNGVLRHDEGGADPQARYEAAAAAACVSSDAFGACFLDRLAGVTDSRKGKEAQESSARRFIGRVSRAEGGKRPKLGQVDFLAQGTLYPDVIESISIVGQSSMIKSHHKRRRGCPSGCACS